MILKFRFLKYNYKNSFQKMLLDIDFNINRKNMHDQTVQIIT